MRMVRDDACVHVHVCTTKLVNNSRCTSNHEKEISTSCAVFNLNLRTSHTATSTDSNIIRSEDVIVGVSVAGVIVIVLILAGSAAGICSILQRKRKREPKHSMSVVIKTIDS